MNFLSPKYSRSLSISNAGLSNLGGKYTDEQFNFGKFPLDSMDLYEPKGLLFVVAEGGNNEEGKEASKTAIEVIAREYFTSRSNIIGNTLFFAFKTANLKIYQSLQNISKFRKNGVTCAAMVIENNSAVIAYVGRAVIYRIRDYDIEELNLIQKDAQLTLPQNKKDKKLNYEILNKMGKDTDVEIEILQNLQIKPGDNFIISSCGLGKENNDEVKKIVSNNEPEEACKKIIAKVIESGLTENISVQVINVSGFDNAVAYEKGNFIKLFPKIDLRYLLIFFLFAFILALGVIFRNNITGIFNTAKSSPNSYQIKTTPSQKPDLPSPEMQKANLF